MISAAQTDMFRFDNSYARLPDGFFARLSPTPVAAPRLIRINEPLAVALGLDPAWLASVEGVAVLAGNRVAAGSEPLAMAYSGHQFGHFSPRLGDGRAMLLGEVIDRDGVRRDVQLKGSGPTPFSRRGDGRAALGPVLREYIVSEAFAALGIATTRALAAVASGEMVWRETTLPGAVLTRIAASHVRVGTFQYFAAHGEPGSVQTLARYVIARHYPTAASAPNPYAALLDAVIEGQAQLIAKWMLVGFIHGVMNTDNMSIAGETIDYGPCAFMDVYHPGTVYSSIDERGRYAYTNQPGIAQWNLARLAETLLPLIDADRDAAIAQAQAALERFGQKYKAALAAGMAAKLGFTQVRDGDEALAQDLLERMAANSADFTGTFRGLCDAALGADHEQKVRAAFTDPTAFDGWAEQWRRRMADEGGDPVARRAAMRSVNPEFIARNHLVEEAIEAAVVRDDLTPFERLLAVLAKPFDDQPDAVRYALPPTPEQVVHQTFCGT